MLALLSVVSVVRLFLSKRVNNFGQNTSLYATENKFQDKIIKIKTERSYVLNGFSVFAIINMRQETSLSLCAKAITAIHRDLSNLLVP